jgi:hypothetical protein
MLSLIPAIKKVKEIYCKNCTAVCSARTCPVTIEKALKEVKKI